MAVLIIFAVRVYAQHPFKVGVWGAYGLVNMTEVKRYFSDTFGILTSTFRTRDTRFNNINDVTVLGLDAGYEFIPSLVIGVRVGRLTLGKGLIEGIATNPFNGRTGSFSIAMDSELLPLMVGGSYTHQLNSRVDVSGAIYLGYALGSAELRYDDSGTGVLDGLFPFGSGRGETSFSGSGIADDVSGEIRYHFTPALSLGAAVHLMTIKITQMSSDYVWQDYSSNPLAFDYSNISAGLSIQFAFY